MELLNPTKKMDPYHCKKQFSNTIQEEQEDYCVLLRRLLPKNTQDLLW